MIIFSLSVILLFTQLYSFGQAWTWGWQDPIPTGEDLADVYLIDSTTIVAVGAGGIVVRSVDGGENWTYPVSHAKQSLRSVDFVDERTGWAGGLLGEITKTNDGGETWESQESEGAHDISTVCAINASTCYVAGFDFANGGSGMVRKTTDGGNTWTSIENLGSYVSGMYFTDNLTAWAVGKEGEIFKTIDGGTNWNSQQSGTTESLNSVYFVNDAIGFAAGDNGTVIKTTNGGTSWEKLSMSSTKTLWSVYFVNENKGWVVGGDAIYYTTNGGTSWVGAMPDKQVYTNYSVHFANESTGWVVGFAGMCIKTTDGGQIWNVLGSEANLRRASAIRDFHFVDKDTGWATGGYNVIKKTTNGGKDWEMQSGPSDVLDGTKVLDAISFTDADKGCAVGISGRALRTTNGGSSWDDLDLGLTENDDLSDIQLTSSGVGWIVGSDGMLFKTSNSGEDWLTFNSGTSRYLYALYFLNNTTGWIVGEKAELRKTTNGGLTWESQTIPPVPGIIHAQLYLMDVYFLDENKGWIVGGGIFVDGDGNVYSIGTILNTTDGGAQWNVQLREVPVFFTGIQFSDENNGWAVGEDYDDLKGVSDLLYRTADGGATWTTYPIVSKALSTVYLMNDSTGWIGGNNSTILSLRKEGDPVGIIESPQHHEDGFYLEQNYPNPFKSTTTINYLVPKKGLVVLDVYNIFGQKITTLVNAEQQAGNYEVVFDASGLTGGYYVYRLKSGHSYSVKKMLLIK